MILTSYHTVMLTTNSPPICDSNTVAHDIASDCQNWCVHSLPEWYRFEGLPYQEMHVHLSLAIPARPKGILNCNILVRQPQLNASEPDKAQGWITARMQLRQIERERN